MTDPDHYGYLETAETVVLSMTHQDYNALLLALGFAAGRADDKPMFWRLIGLVNRLNAGNPHFTPYEIPEAFR
jgi:hypothetical protein